LGFKTQLKRSIKLF